MTSWAASSLSAKSFISTASRGRCNGNGVSIIIEDNEVTGADKLYTALDEQSSAHANNNRKRFGKWPNN